MSREGGRRERVIVKEGEVSDFGAAMTVLSNSHSRDETGLFRKHARSKISFWERWPWQYISVVHLDRYMENHLEISLRMPCILFVTCPWSWSRGRARGAGLFQETVSN